MSITQHVIDSQQPVLKTDEAAKLAGQKAQTWHNNRHLGRGCPYTKIGRSIRYLAKDVEEYITKGRIVPENN
ncbi:MAG: helix-turn-helix domain-containing protein [Desulfobacteraceae bacterium]|nr:helix-turn-helix domain-containing protein [Desulfobacteraceae bacterium]